MKIGSRCSRGSLDQTIVEQRLAEHLPLFVLTKFGLA
jgi:hypothetical protein